VFWCVIGLRVRVLILSAETSPVTNPQYTSVWWITTLMTWENYLTSINAFLLWIKLFKYLHFNPRIQFLYRAFSTAVCVEHHIPATACSSHLIHVCLFCKYSQVIYSISPYCFVSSSLHLHMYVLHYPLLPSAYIVGRSITQSCCACHSPHIVWQLATHHPSLL
jgi:hypothetical protein